VETKSMTDPEDKNVAAFDGARVKRSIALRLSLAPIVLGILFFWPAGTLRYWQAWLYMGAMLIPMSGIIFYFLKKKPEVLERRLRIKEKEQRQKFIVLFGTPILLGTNLLPGFDHRFGWSTVPPALAIASDVVVLAAYFLFFLVLRENPFAGRTVEVERGQKVITTGPYSLVRHPMYAVILILYLFTPLALGSYWTMLPALLIPVLLVARIFNEEQVLSRDLAGYADYMRQVKYRLIPGIW
jgi:protein-S-isoprenylcysteine O-methyltransferase Ste14